MSRKKRESHLEKITSVAGMMAGASIALMGIIILIVYEFSHANDMAGAREWMRIAHLSVFSAGAFAFSTVFGLIYQLMTKKPKRILAWLAIATFVLGWFLVFFILSQVFLQTL